MGRLRRQGSPLSSWQRRPKPYSRASRTRRSTMTSSDGSGPRSTVRFLASTRMIEGGLSRRCWPFFSTTGLMTRAPDNGRAQLCEKVDYWAQRLRVEARTIRVQRMTRKWGSCSTTGTITLAADLYEQEPGFQDFV